jgi:hypothetical protein
MNTLMIVQCTIKVKRFLEQIRGPGFEDSRLLYCKTGRPAVRKKLTSVLDVDEAAGESILASEGIRVMSGIRQGEGIET